MSDKVADVVVEGAGGGALKQDGRCATAGAAVASVPGRDCEVQRVVGRIKWFDPARGFGFIARDDGPDVMLHAACLRREGRSVAHEGAVVTCLAAAGARGLHVVQVLSIDDSQAVHAAERPPPRTHVTVAAEGGFEAGVVKWFNRLRGFGFISRGAGQPDVFVHMETVRSCGVLELKPGMMVRVRFGPGPRGLMATEVYPADDVGAGVRH